MTAVEWLVQQIDNKDMGEIPMWVYDLCYDALELEKQQHELTWEKSGNGSYQNINFEKYYSETYKKDKK